MRHPLLLGALLVSAHLAAQQPVFQTYVGYPYSPDIIELASGNLFTGLGNDEPTAWCTSLLDSAGNLLHTECYAIGSSPGSMSAGFHLKRRTDNEICFATRVVSSDTCYFFNGAPVRKQLPAVGRMDSLGTILSMHSFDMDVIPCYDYPIGIEVLSDNSSIIYGGYDAAFAIKADSSGQVMWAKRFVDARRVVFLEELPNGDLITGINFDAGGAVATRLNTDGEVIWMRSLLRPRGWLTDAVVLEDGTMVVCGVTDREVNGIPWPPDEDPKLFLAALAANGDMLWSKAIDVAYPSIFYPNLALAHNGSINLLIERDYTLVLIRLNTLGDVQWARAYGSNGFGFLNPGVFTSGAGSMIVHGEIWVWADVLFPGFTLGNTGTGILKVDSLGHAPCFDSPTTISLSELATTDSSFVLNYTTGAISSPVIPISIPSTAIYRYDGCLFTGITEHAKNRASIYPNPNQGRFRIESSTEFELGSFIQVFDPMGKLHYQQQLRSVGYTHELDLSHLSKGTYVLRNSGTKTSWHERFVLE